MRLLMLFVFSLLLISCGEEEKTIQVDVSGDSSLEARSSFDDLVASYERPDRSNWQKPKEVLDFLGDDLSDKVVADIGAGSGYFTFRIVPKAIKTIAIDIDPRMISFIDSCKNIYLPDSLEKRLESRLAQPDDPQLKAGEVDVVFLANTYAYIQRRVDYFSRVKKMLRPGGRVVIVDFKKRRIPVGPEMEDKVPLHQAESELLEAGYTQVFANDQLLPYQYILVAVIP